MSKRLKNFLEQSPIHAETAGGGHGATKPQSPVCKIVDPSYANLSGFATTSVIRG